MQKGKQELNQGQGKGKEQDLNQGQGKGKEQDSKSRRAKITRKKVEEKVPAFASNLSR